GKMVDFYNPNSAEVVIAGTAEDNEISYFYGCREYYSYTPTTDLATPVPDANFYINVTGEKFNVSHSGLSTTLNHNICDNLVRTSMFSCSSGEQSWARAFDLIDFGISDEENFVINKGQVGISSADGGATVTFLVYAIDDNFPASFSEFDLIGTSQEVQIPYVSSSSPITRIFTIAFDSPIVVPTTVQRVLVVVNVGIVWGSGVMFIAGTEQDNDVSWYRGCGADENGYNSGGSAGTCNCFITTELLGRPDAKFYINVTGEVNHITNIFEMNISNICSEFLKEFSVENSTDVVSVIWDFGDPASGTNNTSTDLSPFHDFSADGSYTITATVTGKDNSVEILTETIAVKEPPKAFGINNVYACEDNFGSGFSSSFDLSTVENQILQGQIDKVVTYIDGSGNTYAELPNLFSNTVRDRETITVRVSRKEELCCYSETTFDLVIKPLPNVSSAIDILHCEENTDGFAAFDLNVVSESIIDANTNVGLEFYHENGQHIPDFELSNVVNAIQNEETLTIKVTNNDTGCSIESTFKLIVNPLPLSIDLSVLIGCDDNDDGISEFFDTYNVEAEALGNQTGMEVTYFTSNGNQLQSPLPNPFTNSFANEEIITVRVTNLATGCFTEMPLMLKTSNKPQINTPKDIYVCDEGNGYANFDLSTIQNEIIGTQQNFVVSYYNANGTNITNNISANFQNTEPWVQTISVKVENAFSNLCVSETNFSLIVNALPVVVIEDVYYICNLVPSLYMSVRSNLEYYAWTFEDGTIVSSTFEVNLSEAGTYRLTIGEIKNNIFCENTYDFELIRSVLPTIENVEFQELSDHIFININASGDGDFEYSIDGMNFQNDNSFINIQGGTYTVYVRDKLGCGEDSREVTIIDYPKYFTPNGDGYNDHWQIKGISKFPDSNISIFDRYGKLLKRLSSKDLGWDGTYNGEKMSSNDYWFNAKLNNEVIFNGHFTLKR
ncbi:MAG: T9SS type B sorting domain-containing protein, partial [Aquaticitalea sp.]